MLTVKPALGKIISCLLFVFATTILLIISCRKIDHQAAEEPSIAKEESKFFTSHPATDSLVQAILKFVKRENDKYHFADNLIKKIGYPYWNKAIVADRKAGANARVTSDSTNTVFIPFILDSANTVNTTLIVNTSPSDTNFRLVADWQYKNLIYGNPSADTTAENAALMFMLLDRNVFGYNQFKILDSQLFSSIRLTPDINGNRVINFRNNSSPNGKLSVLVTITVCYSTYVCGTPGSSHCTGPNGCDYLDCYNGTSCYPAEACIDFVFDTDPYGGGSGGGGSTGGTGGTSGSGSTGGGGGGGGSWEPPICPGTTVSKLSIIQDCEPGWIPPETGGGGYIPPTLPDPIDSILAKYSRAIKPRTDSLLAKSLLLNWEHSMIIVRNGTSVYLKNEKTSEDSLSTEVDFTLSQNEVLLGYIHCHPSASSNLNDRSAPSGSDVKFLRQKLVTNFVQMAECGNAGYALVIEDPHKAKIFLDSLTRYDLDEQLRDSALTVSGWFSNWQIATQIALMKLLGSATLHGIGFYKSTDAIRETWIKLN